MADEEKLVVTDGTKVGRRPFIYRYGPRHPHARRVFSALLLILLLVGVTFLVLYLVYRPSHPRFSISAASVFSLNSSPNSLPSVVSASMQFTLVGRNPSDHSTVLFDRLSAYVVYRNQPITPPVPLPPFVQEEDSTFSVSPVVGGGEYVPVSKEVAAGLETDRGYGVVGLRLVLMGRVKYKSGPFRSGWNGLYVRCDVLLGIKKGMVGQAPLLGEPQCDVDA